MGNKPSSYNTFSKILHWGSAITVFGLFAAGYWMVDLSYYSEWYKTTPHWHKSIGILLCCVTVVRLLWKVISPAPTISGSPLERKAAISAHHLLYLLLFTLFTTGYLISTADGRGIDVFDWFEVPGMGSFFEDQEDLAGLIHRYTAYTVMGLVSIHAIAALKHHFINKDNTLKKML